MVSFKLSFMQGAVACAEGAIMAGCRFFGGYPITPQSEIMEHMAERLPQVGGFFVQMEDELAAIASCIGASWAGAKAMTATSGPGFSLMQENIGLAAMTETPIVIVEVQRVGPGTGQATKGSQGDIMQARWGSHGDYEVIVLSPNSVQEMLTMMVKAFNLSEKYRVPVIVLTSECVIHMRSNVRIPPRKTINVVNRCRPKEPGEPLFGGGSLASVPPMPRLGEGFNVLMTGSTHNEFGVRYTADPEVHRKLGSWLVNKIRKNRHDIVDAETYNLVNCDVGIVSFGVTSLSVYDAIKIGKEQGINIGFVRPRVLWPFPEEQVRKLAENANFIIVPEMNMGQFVLEVERVVTGRCKVARLNKIGGGELITPQEILSAVKEGIN